MQMPNSDWYQIAQRITYLDIYIFIYAYIWYVKVCIYLYYVYIKICILSHYTSRKNTNVEKFTSDKYTKNALFFVSRAPSHRSFTFLRFLHELIFSTDFISFLHELIFSIDFVSFRPLIFKLQHEVLKFSDICVSWNSPTTDLEIYVNCECQLFAISNF